MTTEDCISTLPKGLTGYSHSAVAYIHVYIHKDCLLTSLSIRPP